MLLARELEQLLKMIQDVEAFLSKLNKANFSAIDEETITAIVAQIDEMLQLAPSLTDASDVKKVSIIFEAYLLWAENFINDCSAEKQHVADELVLLQRRKNAKEHYQR